MTMPDLFASTLAIRKYAILDPSISNEGPEYLILSFLLDLAGARKRCVLSLRLMAADTGVEPQVVREIVGKLESLGYLVAVPRGDEFDIIFPLDAGLNSSP